MPAKNSSISRRDFGVFLGNLRNSRAESQHEFAATLSVSRSVIANTETGYRQPGEDLLAQLVKLFPEHGREIEDEAKRHGTSPRTPSDPSWSATQRLIDVQIETDELQQARGTIVSLLTTGPKRRIRQRLWLHMRLWDIEASQNRPAALDITLRPALQITKRIKLPKAQVLSLYDQYACAALWNDDAELARSVLNDGLADFPKASQLWYRKGIVEWKEGDLSGAHAALSTALKYKPTARADILALRGQVLSEWRRHKEAYRDLARSLDGSASKPMDSAAARGALLWNACVLGEMPHADIFAAFDQLERSASGNAWLAYYRGLCNLSVGNDEDGWRHLEESVLIHDNPSLYKWLADKINEELDERLAMQVLREPVKLANKYKNIIITPNGKLAAR